MFGSLEYKFIEFFDCVIIRVLINAVHLASDLCDDDWRWRYLELEEKLTCFTVPTTCTSCPTSSARASSSVKEHSILES